MAKKSSPASNSATKTVTPERAARLHKLLQLLGTGPQTRSVLMRRLSLDIRGFYRDLEVLRAAGIAVQLQNRRYVLEQDVDEAVARLPFPDPRLTLGEAKQLAKGRTRAHRKLKEQIEAIVATRASKR